MTDFTWEEYYHLAEELVINENEAHARSAISRYYYAIFGLARQYIIKNKKYKYLSKYASSNHRKVSKILSESDDKTERDVGKNLSALRKIRNKADYDLNIAEDYLIKEKKYSRKNAKIALDSMKDLMNR